MKFRLTGYPINFCAPVQYLPHFQNLKLNMERDDATLEAEEKEVEASTQTQLKDVEEDVNRSLSVLANRFFHSAYWFSILGLRFASFSLPTIKSNMKTRREISLDSAEQILMSITDSLSSRDAIQLADIAKPEPKPKFSKLSVDQAVKIVEDLDEWLLKSIETVLYHVHNENSPLKVELLEQLLMERKILLRESRNMNSDKFVLM